MKRRLPGYVLAVCMAASMLPVAAVAEGLAGESQPACTCEEICTTQAMNEGCPVCSMAGAAEQDRTGRVVELCDSDEQDTADEEGFTPPADADKPVVADPENPADGADDAAHSDVALDDADTDVEGAPVSAVVLPGGVTAVQTLIDALPDAQDVTDEARADLEAQLGAIDEAKAALSDDELAMLDFGRP